MPRLLIFVITQVFIAAQLSGQDPEMPLNRTLSLPEVISLDLMGLFQELNDQGITIVLVTHEHDIARHSKRCVKMSDGLIVGDERIKDRHDARKDLENSSEKTGL